MFPYARVCIYIYMYSSFFRVRKSLRAHIGDLDVGAVACGFGRAIGNKVKKSFNSIIP